MDFGMPTLIELNSLEECAALCGELGLQFIELNMNLPQYQSREIDDNRYRAVMDGYGIYFTFHLDENLNVCDFNPYVAEAYLNTVREAIAVSKRLKVPILNMHFPRGVYFTLPNKKVYLFEQYRERYLNGITAFREMCEEEIGNADIKICIENSNGFLGFQIEGLELLLKSPVFALTFDIGHNYCIGGGDEALIKKHLSKLRHMHMHDASGKNDHLALGDGEINLPQYFSLAQRQNARIVLETKTIEGLRKSVKYAERFL